MDPEEQAAAAAANNGGEEGAGESTTPEEVAEVLKNSGITLPPEPKPAASEGEEGEEGIDPDDPKETEEQKAEREAKEAQEAAEAEEAQREEQEKAEKAKAAAEAAKNAAPEDEKYSFEVTDANNVTFKIGPGDTMETILAEFEPKNNGQIIDILDKLRDAKDAKKADEATAAKDAEEASQNQRVQDIRDGWDNEIKDLRAQKRIVEGEDGQTRIDEVMAFMGEENQKRIEANKPTLNSFEDALDKLEAKEEREQKAEAAKAAKEQKRRDGSLVGGSSAPSSGGSPVYRAGSARNANDAIRKMNLL